MNTPSRATLLFIILLLVGGCGSGGERERKSPGGGDDAPQAGASSGRAVSFADEGLSVLFISIDTCRPDHLGCYGYERIETPAIDALAAGGARFARAVSSIPLTLPSHSTFMTGLFPYRHRVRNNGTYRLGERINTLAETMKANGYATAAIVGAFPLDSRFGLDQGFDLYDDRFPPKDLEDLYDVSERTADDVVNRAIDWLSRTKKKKTFLFLHFFDPHWRYEPPEPFRSRYRESPYDGEIAFVDSELERLFETLDRFGLRKKTIVVLTGDHGESLGDHGESTHGVFVYESTIRIPLIVSWPDREEFSRASLRRGSVVRSQVRGVDIAPTLLDLAGLAPLDGVDGVSLVPLLIDPGVSLELVNYSESMSPLEDFGWSAVRALSGDEWKFIRVPREELYRLSDDPQETTNVADRFQDKVDAFRRLLDPILVEDRAKADEDEVFSVDVKSREKLEALGYVTSRKGTRGADVDGAGDRADPKDKIGLIARYQYGRTLQGKGDLGEAIAVFEELEKVDPRNLELIKSLAQAYLSAGDLGGADNMIARASRLAPPSLSLIGLSAALHFKRGESDQAVADLEEILRIDPKYEEAHLRLGDVYLTGGDTDRAAEEYQKELATYPDSPAAFNGLGKVYKTIGRREEAIKFFRKAIESRDDFAEPYYNLANIYNEEKNLEKAIVYYKRAIENDPQLVEAYYNFALLAKGLGKKKEAFTLLTKAVEKNPGFAKGYYGIGNFYREAGNLEEAVRQYTKGSELDLGDADILLNLGVALAGLGHYEEAIRVWEKAAAVAPGSPSAETAKRNALLAREQIGGLR